MSDIEFAACTPAPLNPNGFNKAVVLPYGLEVGHVRSAMEEFLGFLGFINTQLRSRQVPRLEMFMMPASFSGMVGEYMNVAIPKYCTTLVKNGFHNGHPDLVPIGVFPNNSVQYSHEGLEVKASRRGSGWQGHNPENIWLMMFSFENNSANDGAKNRPPVPFRFLGVYAAQLELTDWKFAGRSETSRRTITATINPSGMAKLKANWIYKASEQAQLELPDVPVEET